MKNLETISFTRLVSSQVLFVFSLLGGDVGFSDNTHGFSGLNKEVEKVREDAVI